MPRIYNNIYLARGNGNIIDSSIRSMYSIIFIVFVNNVWYNVNIDENIELEVEARKDIGIIETIQRRIETQSQQYASGKIIRIWLRFPVLSIYSSAFNHNTTMYSITMSLTVEWKLECTFKPKWNDITIQSLTCTRISEIVCCHLFTISIESV